MPRRLQLEQAALTAARNVPSPLLVKDCALSPLSVAIEPSLRTDASFVNTLRDAVDLCERTGLGVIVDFANCWMERDLGEVIARAGPHIALVQIDDVVIGGPGRPSPGGRVNIGEGDLPVRRLMQYVLATDYRGPFDLEVLGPVDHKIIYSIYFHDPNGLRLEITAPTSPTWNDNIEPAHASLADWQTVKERAAASGDDMVTVLAELTRERSHRRSS